MLRGISRGKYIEFFELIILLKCSIELKLNFNTDDGQNQEFLNLTFF